MYRPGSEHWQHITSLQDQLIGRYRCPPFLLGRYDCRLELHPIHAEVPRAATRSKARPPNSDKTLANRMYELLVRILPTALHDGARRSATTVHPRLYLM